MEMSTQPPDGVEAKTIDGIRLQQLWLTYYPMPSWYMTPARVQQRDEFLQKARKIIQREDKRQQTSHQQRQVAENAIAEDGAVIAVHGHLPERPRPTTANPRSQKGPDRLASLVTHQRAVAQRQASSVHTPRAAPPQPQPSAARFPDYPPPQPPQAQPPASLDARREQFLQYQRRFRQAQQQQSQQYALAHAQARQQNQRPPAEVDPTTVRNRQRQYGLARASVFTPDEIIDLTQEDDD
ncbi:hypothetical protein CLAFUW4_03804 [Fulvia fulva]|uniref:Uncharacterized protein n=1 Tax=Passalora fulva TaxID=5499 RepID=A0A9Q8LB59_PASFU|nr:uncharacterized protein CLAFUR5_03776 [Fulvia fulva]KAK4631426.1 hypothetical protein CLAFUR4_03792 [Fulvia fulva]KAK4633595.1 hypothetical protein CLAFUR0_03791 [Fulvia fulva]UJO14197.1 hypothetical protein CLAFUR5_03776 [Fulvia fulva]WPV10812.1 hypothetical protein CLAFUW4_03804 [Fulvia fulva]WPV26493.1 hypothetical protein CLAFUW7_03796 [Fulvia fulva]